jgi:hypothetical protein
MKKMLAVLLGCLLVLSTLGEAAASTAGCTVNGGLNSNLDSQNYTVMFGERNCSAKQNGTLSVTLYNGGWGTEYGPRSVTSYSYYASVAPAFRCTPSATKAYFVVIKFTSGSTISKTLGPLYRPYSC